MDEPDLIPPPNELEATILKLAKQPGGIIATELKNHFPRRTRTSKALQKATLRLFDDMFIAYIDKRIVLFDPEDRIPLPINPLSESILNPKRKVKMNKLWVKQKIVVASQNKIPHQDTFTVKLACGHEITRRECNLPKKQARCQQCIPDEKIVRAKLPSLKWHRKRASEENAPCTICGATVPHRVTHRALTTAEKNNYLKQYKEPFGEGFAKKIKGGKVLWFRLSSARPRRRSDQPEQSPGAPTFAPFAPPPLHPL